MVAERRVLLALIAGAAILWPLRAHAQLADRMRRVGILLATREDDPEMQARIGILKKGLETLGWAEGRNIRFDYRWAGGDAARARGDAAAIVSLAPDLIVANSTLCLKAVQPKTSTIPIVFVVVADPVGQGFVSSLSHPGGNITGFTAFEFEIGGKWLNLLTEVAPGVRRVVFMFNPDAGPYAGKFVESMKAAALALGVEVFPRPIRNTDEIDPILREMATKGHSGVIVNPDAFTFANRRLFISTADDYRLPAIYAYRYCAIDGGLLSYGHEYNELFSQATVYVDKILRGAKPADLPVQNPTKFELTINLKTAKAIGITVPGKLTARADEVIE